MKDIIELSIENPDYPKDLLKIKNPPKLLYAQGDLSLLNKNKVAIVGSRDCSLYGYKCATKISKELAKNNICVVSGLAKGIDTAGHSAAIKEVGKTIAVLGGGFNNIYPKENLYLYKEIIHNGGLILSEYPPDSHADTKNFPIRNRIVSGLSTSVIVIEARYRSGSSITARYATEQNKTVFCVPSNLGTITGVGTNILISKGAKILVDLNDVFNEFNLNISTPEPTPQEIPPEFQELYDSLTYMPININDICKKLNKPITEVSQQLAMLELDDLVISMPGNNFRKKDVIE